jgi:hypothetical protein
VGMDARKDTKRRATKRPSSVEERGSNTAITSNNTEP